VAALQVNCQVPTQRTPVAATHAQPTHTARDTFNIAQYLAQPQAESLPAASCRRNEGLYTAAGQPAQGWLSAHGAPRAPLQHGMHAPRAAHPMLL
jgi:hypothetical protein